MKKSISTIIIFALSLSLSSKTKAGLALSGGGALGYAHIGVLQAFDEHDIRFDCVSGTSMGAIIGVLYAAGFTPQDMMKMIKDNNLNKKNRLLSPAGFAKNGMASHKTLRAFLLKTLPHDSFDSLKIKYYACLTDLDKARWVTFGKGPNLSDYVVASSSIPAVYETAKTDSAQYTDGGLLNNLPAQPLSNIEHCDIIVGIDVLPFIKKHDLPKIKDVFLYSIRIVQHENSRKGRELCKFLIEPKALEKYNEFDFDKYIEIYEYGYKTAIEYIQQHPEILKLQNKK